MKSTCKFTIAAVGIGVITAFYVLFRQDYSLNSSQDLLSTFLKYNQTEENNHSSQDLLPTFLKYDQTEENNQTEEVPLHNYELFLRENIRDTLPPESTWLLNSGNKNSNDGRITKIINKIYIQKDGVFPVENDQLWKEVRLAHDLWNSTNSGYEFQYFDLRLCRAYLTLYFNPIFLRAFDCLQAFAIKADFFRYVLIYREGGWYSDWKQVPLKNNILDELASETSESSGKSSTGSGIIDLFVTYDHGNAHGVKNNCLANGFFGARPRHPLLTETIKLIFDNIYKEYYGAHCLDPTGPCAFGQAFKNIKISNAQALSKIKIGVFKNSHFYKNLNSKEKPLVKHKCDNCGTSQSWENGNDYPAIWSKKKFYCEDAKSLFQKI